MSNDEQNNGSEGQTSPGIDALDSILAKESAKANDEREQISQTLKAQEAQRRSDEKAEFESRRNALLAERQEATRRRQDQIQKSAGSSNHAPPVDAETQRMIPGTTTGLHQPKRTWMVLLILCLLGGGAGFAILGTGPTDSGAEGSQQGNADQTGSPENGQTTAVITTDVQASDAKGASGAQTAGTDSGAASDAQSAAKDGTKSDAKIVIAPRPKPRVVTRPKARRPKSKAKPKPSENGGGMIKLRQGLGGR